MKLNEMPSDKLEIVRETVRRAEAHGSDEKQQHWFVGYLVARDEGATHAQAMDLADRYVKEAL